MNFTTLQLTTASETIYGYFCPYWDSSGRHSREKLLFRYNKAGLTA